MYYYRARYYSPQLQRFISEDPIGVFGGINFYNYVGNDPINLFDPFGLKNPRYKREQPPVPFPGPKDPPGAPGASKPPKGSVIRFVGYTYTHLYRYTLENFDMEGVFYLSQDRRRLVDPEAAKIPCGNIQVFYFWFTIDNYGVHGQFLSKRGDPCLTSKDTQRVTIDVTGRRNCPSTYDVLRMVK